MPTEETKIPEKGDDEIIYQITIQAVRAMFIQVPSNACNHFKHIFPKTVRYHSSAWLPDRGEQDNPLEGSEEDEPQAEDKCLTGPCEKWGRQLPQRIDPGTLLPAALWERAKGNGPDTR